MKLKYLIMKNDENDKLVIREFGELDKDMYSLLCEETYDSKTIKSAIAGGETALISVLRTQSLFPVDIYAKKMAEAVINMYASENDQSVELFFNDVDLITKEQEKPMIVDDINSEPAEIDDLLEDDVIDPDIEDKDGFKNITSPLKVIDDDSETAEDDGN